MKSHFKKKAKFKKPSRPISQKPKNVNQRMSDIDWELLQRETGQLEPIEQ